MRLHPPYHYACRYTAAKRFGLEGCETLIPGMKAMIDRITDLECKNIVIGMPHRGERYRLSGEAECYWLATHERASWTTAEGGWRLGRM
jgi:hypothetical protein